MWGSKLQFLPQRGAEGARDSKKGEGETGNRRKSGWASWRSQCFLEGPRNCFILERVHEALEAPEFSVGPPIKHLPEFLAFKECRNSLNSRAPERLNQMGLAGLLHPDLISISPSAPAPSCLCLGRWPPLLGMPIPAYVLHRRRSSDETRDRSWHSGPPLSAQCSWPCLLWGSFVTCEIIKPAAIY